MNIVKVGVRQAVAAGWVVLVPHHLPTLPQLLFPRDTPSSLQLCWLPTIISSREAKNCSLTHLIQSGGSAVLACRGSKPLRGPIGSTWLLF